MKPISRSCRVTMLVVILATALAMPASAADFALRYVDHTASEIVIAWDPVPEATSYVIERSTIPGFDSGAEVAYAVSAGVTGFGDTGWPLSDPRRFAGRSNTQDSPTYHLDVATDYYYRVSAATPAGTLLSNIIGPRQIANYSTPSEVVRGVAGDLWADVLLGQIRFGENTWWKTDPYHTQYGAGVLIDRNTSHPTHVFLADGNHNRILGVAALGRCKVSQAPCSIDADCDGQRCTLLPGQMAPQFVLGQPADTDYGACNGDATAQTYPNPLPASASSLCFLWPYQISIGETVATIQMAVDHDHNLYVPDQFNNRVLMYRDPFNPANGTAAVAVWGQESFAGTACNSDAVPWAPTMRSLCGPASVDIDDAGDLWVADQNNHRVVRFPREPDSSGIATTADAALTGLWSPTSVRADSQGNVFVGDVGGLRQFSNPQPGDNPTSQLLDYINADPDYRQVTLLAFDPRSSGRLWAEISWFAHVLIDLPTQRIVHKVYNIQLRGMDVSQTGDLFSVTPHDQVAGLYRLNDPIQQAGTFAGDPAFAGYGVPNLNSLVAVTGMTIARQQLLISDRFFVYFWNDYHRITQGTEQASAADGRWGDPSLSYLHGAGFNYLVRSDASGRIWMANVVGLWFGDPSGQVIGQNLGVFEPPLTETSVPDRVVPVNAYKDANGDIVPLPAGVSVSIRDFLPVGLGNRVWVADDDHARVVRVANLDGWDAPGKPPYVDIVLGQTSWAGTECNHGAPAGIARDTLCSEERLSLDPAGNLFVQDNVSGGYDGGTTRLLRWDAATIPDQPAQTLFGILPDSVYGNGAASNFGALCDPSETACTIRAAAFTGDRIMVAGANPYAGPRFPMVYLNKEENHQPQFALGDFVSFPGASLVDPDGNLYLADFDWSRVLVYKAPFSAFAPPRETFTPTLTPPWTRTPTPTVTTTPTVTPTATRTNTPHQDLGFVPPDGLTSSCETTVARNLSAIAACALQCHIKQAAAGLAQRAFDEPACVEGTGAPLSCRAAYDRSSASVLARKPAPCPACLGAPVQAGLGAFMTDFVASNNGQIYCAGTTELDGAGNGFVPPDRKTASCENAVARSLSRLFVCVRKCHVRYAQRMRLNHYFPEQTCEMTCRDAYDRAGRKLLFRGSCPACLDAAAQGNLADQVTSFLENANAQIFCAGAALLP